MKFEIHFEFRASLRKFQDLNFWDATTVHPAPAIVPTTRARLATVSRDLSRVQPRAQQGAPPRPTSASALRGVTTSPDLSLGLRRSLRLARPGPRTDYATGDTSLPYP
jgi:hypothetical protein